MDKLIKFLPLTKADAAQRLVWGTAALEVADKSGEIMDYATAKPAFEKWSAEIAAASGGKSLGNVRLMHGKTAVGKIVEMTFDDVLKKIDVCVKVVDDGCWKLVEEGVLSAFSIGGGYAKKWVDATNKMLKRYTPALSELSLVDNPCIPGATISLVKADGVEEEVVIRADGTLAKADEPDAEDDVEAALAAALHKAKDPKKPYGDVAYADPEDGKYPIDTAAHIRAAWSYVNMPKNAKMLGDKAEAVKDRIVAAWKDKIDKAGPPSIEKMALFGEDPAKSMKLVAAIRDASLEKGFYTISSLASAMSRFSDIAESVIYEERSEQDTDSMLPQAALDIMAQMRTFLVEMVNEETAEFMQGCERVGGDMIALLAPICDPDLMEMAAAAVQLHKADTDLMEKIGAKISGSNMKHVQAAHDHMAMMGAKCDSDNCDKAADAESLLKAENARLKKAIRTATAAIEAGTVEKTELAKKFDEISDRLAKIENQPAPAKGIVFDRMTKADEMADAPGADPKATPDRSDAGLGNAVVWSADPAERVDQARRLINGMVGGPSTR